MRLLLLLAALVALSASAEAQTCTTSWAAPVNGLFSDASKWTAGVPNTSGTACIQQPGHYTVTFDLNRTIGRLEVGGASGTQTVSIQAPIVIQGGRVAPTGRIEIGPASGGSILRVADVLTVEGTLVASAGANLLRDGGTLDVAPGGRLVADLTAATFGSGLNIGSFSSGVPSILRVRGRFEAVFGPGAGRVTVFDRVEIDSGTVATSGTPTNPLFSPLQFSGAGLLRNTTFDVPAGTRVVLGAGQNASGFFLTEGTLVGTVLGDLILTSELRAGTGEIVLNVGGTGLLAERIGNSPVFLTTTGGAFRNTGVFRTDGLGLNARRVVFENEGTMRLAREASTVATARAGSSTRGSSRRATPTRLAARRAPSTASSAASPAPSCAPAPGRRSSSTCPPGRRSPPT